MWWSNVILPFPYRLNEQICFCPPVLYSHSRHFGIWKSALHGTLFWSAWPHCACFIH